LSGERFYFLVDLLAAEGLVALETLDMVGVLNLSTGRKLLFVYSGIASHFKEKGGSDS
jgi:hypothetical protein